MVHGLSGWLGPENVPDKLKKNPSPWWSASWYYEGQLVKKCALASNYNNLGSDNQGPPVM